MCVVCVVCVVCVCFFVCVCVCIHTHTHIYWAGTISGAYIISGMLFFAASTQLPAAGVLSPEEEKKEE